jgi:aminoglycoside phosphotransferase (APT) family kinase protein
MTGTHSFDATSLRQYLAATLDGDEQVHLDPVESGRSNETFIVTWGDRQFVLRKPPNGASSDAAHDVLREFRLMAALQDTAVPVPRTLLACEDADVIGSEFYLMSYLDGHVIRETEPSAFASAEHREQFGKTVVDTLAAIHDVDVAAVGLDTIGHPDRFTARQVERWRKQLDWALDRTDRCQKLDQLADVGDWLDANVPSSTPTALVHGDYKVDNLVFGRDPPPEIAGVLDWELGTYGDPLTDVGWLLVHWQDETDPDPILPSARPRFLAEAGYPSRRWLVERYERASCVPVGKLRFYRGLAAFKEAAACEVFYARYIDGTENPFFEQMEENVPLAAERAKEIVDGDRVL